MNTFWRYRFKEQLYEAWNCDPYYPFKDIWVDHVVEHHGHVLWNLVNRYAASSDLRVRDKLADTTVQKFFAGFN